MEKHMQTIRLFKSIIIKDDTKKTPSNELMKQTLRMGFVFSPEVVGNYDEKELIKLADEIGMTSEQLNSSFHKSWNKIIDSTVEQLAVEQIAHYITTYGFESLGIGSDPFIPNEKLDLPSIDVSKLVKINGITKDGIRKKLFTLLSGIALSKETIDDVIEVIKLVGFDIKEVKNKEIACILYSNMKLIPENPIEFLRYLIYTCTKNTLLIKDPQTILELCDNMVPKTNKLLLEYKKMYGLERLSEIFYRFKPLWLTFKKYDANKPLINKIRKLAKKNHKPMKEDYINSITSKLKNGVQLSVSELTSELSKVNIFRKIRLAYALQYRCSYSKKVITKPIMYRIRNSNAYSTKITIKTECSNRTKKVLNIEIGRASCRERV